ncbi:MAG: OsmC family protein [Deltaproteobacteria bacterium]|nr:OsmC family protein [Deltaproteobacteria bacterium]
MASTSELIVTLPGGRRVDAQLGGHVIHTDQPLDNGGQDTAPSPFELFLAAMGTCAGIFVQGFCASRGLATEGIQIVERPHYDAHGVLTDVELELKLPAGFPVKYREPLVRVIEQCSVKRAIQNHPSFTVKTTVAGGGASEAARPA